MDAHTERSRGVVCSSGLQHLIWLLKSQTIENISRICSFCGVRNEPVFKEYELFFSISFALFPQ